MVPVTLSIICNSTFKLLFWTFCKTDLIKTCAFSKFWDPELLKGSASRWAGGILSGWAGEKRSLIEGTTVKNLCAVACSELCSSGILTQRGCKEIDVCLLDAQEFLKALHQFQALECS